MGCPLCWHPIEEESTAMLNFQLCGPRGAGDGDPPGGTVSVQVCPNCGLSLFIMPNEPLSLISHNGSTN